MRTPATHLSPRARAAVGGVLALALPAWPAGALARTTTLQTGSHASLAPAAPSVATKISWHACTDPYLKKGKAQCGTLTVPLDHAKPAGPKITLAVARKLHTTTPYRGVMFSNPGGPGGSAEFLALEGAAFGKVGESYDWYGLDPRGVGESRPALTCNGTYFGYDRKPYEPLTAAIRTYWLNKAKGYAAACGSSAAKELLPHLRTTDNVADLESLRAALGVDQVSFYGFSYGTYIAQVYATLHPTSLKRIVMDGVIDSSHVFYQSNLDQDQPFETNLDKWFAWIGRHDSTYHLGSSEKAVAKAFDALKTKLTHHPAGGGKIGPDEMTDALLPVGYTVFAYPALAEAFAKLDQGDAQEMQYFYRYSVPSGKGADNGYAVYLGTECTDALWPKGFGRTDADNTKLDRTAPFETWANAWYNDPCRSWPAPGRAPVKVTGAALTVPVLLVSETLDAATPFSGALHTRSIFPTSALVAAVGGTNHANSPSSTKCEKGVVTAFLASGKLPARKAGSQADKNCDTITPPEPQPTSSRVTAMWRGWRLGLF